MMMSDGGGRHRLAQQVRQAVAQSPRSQGHRRTAGDQPAPAGRLVFGYGTGTVVPRGRTLVLEAAAADAESLARVKDVMQRDLESSAPVGN